VNRSRTGRLLIALGLMLVFVIAMVVVIGEMFIRPEAEEQIAKALVDELGLVEPPEVDVRGFPLVLRAVQERLDGIDVTVEGEVFEGMRVEVVELRIDDVSFDTGELLRGSGTLEIGGGGGTARITDDDVTEYLVANGLPATVEFAPGTVGVSGQVTVGGVTADASVSGELALTGNRLRFTPIDVRADAFGQIASLASLEAAVRQHFTFEVPVPQLDGVQLTAVAIDDGTASISAAVAPRTVAY